MVVIMAESPLSALQPSLSRTRRALLALACLLAGLSLSACGKSLFPQDQARTQFDRYDRSRDEYAPTYIEDEFGRQLPNLRGRLAPKR